MRYYVATDAAQMTVDALSEDDAARIFAESEGLRGVEDKASLLDVCEAAGGWANVEEALS